MARQTVKHAKLISMIHGEFDEHEPLLGYRIWGVELVKDHDETGCNWAPPKYVNRGDEPQEKCMPLINDILVEFQNKYNIDD